MDKNVHNAASEQQSRSGSMGETRFPPEEQGWQGAPEGAAQEAVREVGTQIGEVAEYIGYYLGAKRDAIMLSLKNAGIYAALGVVGLLAGGALVVTAVVLLCQGIAQAL